MIPRLLNVPATNFKRVFRSYNSALNLVDSKVRRDVMRKASKAFQCSYCTAHLCSLGNAFTGPFLRTVSAATSSPAAALELAEAASVIPHQVTKEMIGAVRDAFGDSGLKQITGFVGLMGWLNNAMEGCGMPLKEYFSPEHHRQETSRFWSLPKFLTTGVAVARTKIAERSWFKVPKNPINALKNLIGFVPAYILQLDGSKPQRA
eukprot:8517514-Ditylum_brightwellii.AAC.1